MLSDVSAEVHRRWTYKFLEGFAREIYHIYVHGPCNNHEIEKFLECMQLVDSQVVLAQPTVSILDGECVLPLIR